MAKLQLPYEIYPYIVSQKWGNPDPVYLQFGFGHHNGVDVLPAKDKKLYAPFDYEVVWAKWMPNGGGHVLGILSVNEYDGPYEKPAFVLIDYLHNEKILVKPGTQGKAGDLLCITDNTGFSTGPHSHMQYRWERKKGGKLVDVEKNDAHNSFDPEPYRNGVYALSISLEKQVGILQKILTLLGLQKDKK